MAFYLAGASWRLNLTAEPRGRRVCILALLPGHITRQCEVRVETREGTMLPCDFEERIMLVMNWN